MPMTRGLNFWSCAILASEDEVMMVLMPASTRRRREKMLTPPVPIERAFGQYDDT